VYDKQQNRANNTKENEVLKEKIRNLVD